MERHRVRFIGRVQGVGFRATTREVARGFAVRGWVRNEPDGSVLLEVQGAAEELQRFLGALRARMARFIATQDDAAIPIQDGEDGFRIDR